MANALAKYIADKDPVAGELLELLAFNEKMAELGRMAAGVVHELNTPLSVIVSATQMILREEGLPDFVREMVERVNQEAHRLSDMTKGVLSFTRRDVSDHREADVNQVLREAMTLLRYEAHKRSIAVIEDLDYRLPFIAADANRAKQVIINLVMNALQAMGEGGKLFIRTSRNGEGGVTVQVTDTGPGIPAELLGHIFTPFFTTKEPGEGTGLGLFITRKLMESVGGAIAVESTVGEGTSFTLTFVAAE
ncbi:MULTISPECIES: nitrogen fixation two-component system sensor histidine kinase GnfK [Geobacter]|uniref:nitrogen fixation two-component system sensor histidine kinase GnfK n=1 Tax=Geobacter TaxID=28231 RepID=UPI002573CB71|nr:nitrogen fixation two-component system sensor histidine kinase GnfK [Geobacter sulfurreducens]BEH11054.1 nitrogen fixation two-component system sensor histidine kinase GnfK [Geobacter sulfurreducens subsp. ethanolicus]BET58903.1 nitrogen fixation two-component system sensor histidine kinase GnfK [Geobacter sp. 60473]